jgi:hypothetical protein
MFWGRWRLARWAAESVDNRMMHRLFLPALGALALTLAIPAPAEAAMGGGGGGGGHGMGLGLGGGGHGSMGLGIGGGSGYGSMSLGLGGGHASMGLGGSRGPVGLGLTRGIGSPGGDDIHLGLSSRELGLGNNFGLDAPDNVLSRAARVGTSPLPGMGTRPGDRPSLQGPDSGTTGDTQHSSQGAKGLQTGDNGSKGNIFKKDEEQIERSSAIEEQEQILEQSQLAAERAADLPPTPTPSSPAASTTTVPSPAAPTLPDLSPAVTTTLGSGEVTMIGAYFAQHGAPVSSVPTSSVNVSVGGTVPDSVALFPPPYDLVNQVSDPDFSYFVSGQNVVIVDGQTNVVSAIIPDVLAHQD